MYCTDSCACDWCAEDLGWALRWHLEVLVSTAKLVASVLTDGAVGGTRATLR